MAQTEIVNYDACFICGPDNPIGLKVRFYTDGDDAAVAEYTPDANHEGYRGIFHGGLTASLLDEVMIKAALARKLFVVTAEMTVRYKKPIVIGRPLICRGRILEHKGRRITTEGTVSDRVGTIYAAGTGVYLEVNDTMREKLRESLPS